MLQVKGVNFILAQYRVLNIKTQIGQNSVAWKKVSEKATVHSKSFVADSSAQPSEIKFTDPCGVIAVRYLTVL